MFRIYYSGELTTQMEHSSGQWVGTDAPVDNAGKGGAFSPTDLVAAALASCMLTVMAIYARTHNMQLANANATVRKSMMANPRRIAAVQIEMNMPSSLLPHQRVALEKIAKECPVARSLHPEMVQEVRFFYTDV